MKMTNKVRGEIELAILDLKRGLDYLAGERVSICRTGGAATTTLHMTRPMDGKIFYEVNKDIGSNITGLRESLRKLEHMIEPELETMDA